MAAVPTSAPGPSRYALAAGQGPGSLPPPPPPPYQPSASFRPPIRPPSAAAASVSASARSDHAAAAFEERLSEVAVAMRALSRLLLADGYAAPAPASASASALVSTARVPPPHPHGPEPAVPSEVRASVCVELLAAATRVHRSLLSLQLLARAKGDVSGAGNATAWDGLCCETDGAVALFPAAAVFAPSAVIQQALCAVGRVRDMLGQAMTASAATTMKAAATQPPPSGGAHQSLATLRPPPECTSAAAANASPLPSDGRHAEAAATGPGSGGTGDSPAGPRAVPPEALQHRWADLVGVGEAVAALRQAVLLPRRVPHLFSGSPYRRPWRSILLYGPPGTGKTALASAAARESGAHFISASAADLLSKWVGASEQHVRALFDLSCLHAHQPQPQPQGGASRFAIIFLDEVDALCSVRGSSGESEAARRVKTEFLVRMQALDPRQAVVIAATNSPWELDPAFRRRFDRFVHVGLPTATARREFLLRAFRSHSSSGDCAGGEGAIPNTKDDHSVLPCAGAATSLPPPTPPPAMAVVDPVSDSELDAMVAALAGYSGSDIDAVLKHAFMAPVAEAEAATQFVQSPCDGRWYPHYDRGMDLEEAQGESEGDEAAAQVRRPDLDRYGDDKDSGASCSKRGARRRGPAVSGDGRCSDGSGAAYPTPPRAGDEGGGAVAELGEAGTLPSCPTLLMASIEDIPPDLLGLRAVGAADVIAAARAYPRTTNDADALRYTEWERGSV